MSSPNDTDSAPVIVNRSTCEQRILLGDLDEWELADDVVEGRDSDPSSYLGVFMGDEFPGTTNSLDFYLPKYRYAAMEFTVPESLETGHRGHWAMEVSGTTFWGTEYGQGLIYFTISDCPGDFDINHFEDDACINVDTLGVGASPTRWSTDPDYDPTRHCFIEPGETYYLNVMFTGEADETLFPPPQSSCGDFPNCVKLLQPQDIEL